MPTERWWPEGYFNPAFEVKRQSFGTAAGGDYVRGSSVVTLPATALRTQTALPDEFLVTGKALLFTRPYTDPELPIEKQYGAIEIFWSWPSFLVDTWQEVALVRSAYGCPQNPQDGQRIFRALRSEFDEDPEGRIREQMLPPPVVIDILKPTRVLGPEGEWVDGITPNGHWYYYTLFFRTNPLDWVIGMQDQCLLPRDWRHRDHLWNAVPPYYQWVDDNYRVGNGFLQQFLRVFGFSQDNTRQFVESVLNLYRVDETPMALLKGLGANFGVPYEAGLGDARYRGLVAYIPEASSVRGTAAGLRGVIESASKWECQITPSTNLLSLPDDSQFDTGIGNWGGLHPVSVYFPTVGTVLSWEKIGLSQVLKTPPTGGGLGVMRVITNKVDATTSYIVVISDSVRRNDYPPGGYPVDPNSDIAIPPYVPPPPDQIGVYNGVEALPLYGAVSVLPGRAYGFSASVASEAVGVTIQPIIMWIGDTGEPHDVLSIVEANPLGAPDTAFHEYAVMAIAPSLDPDEPAHIDPSVSVVTSPKKADFLAAADVCIVVHGIVPVEWTAATPTLLQYADAASTNYRLWVSALGLSFQWGTTNYIIATRDELAGLGPGPISFGVSVIFDYDSRGRISAVWYDANAHRWKEFGTPARAATILPVATDPAAAVMQVGGRTTGTGLPDRWPGFIEWAEMRSGTVPDAGTLLWRMDPNDYTSGTTWTDSRGEPWTVSSAAAVVEEEVGQRAARYLVPGFRISGRVTGTRTNRSPAIDVAGATVYLLSTDDTTVSVVAPDRYLTLGDSAEQLGVPKTGFEGFIIGAPGKKPTA